MSRRKPDVFSSQLGLQTGVERLFSALSLPELIRQEPLADSYMLPLRHTDPVRTLEGCCSHNTKGKTCIIDFYQI